MCVLLFFVSSTALQFYPNCGRSYQLRNWTTHTNTDAKHSVAAFILIFSYSIQQPIRNVCTHNKDNATHEFQYAFGPFLSECSKKSIHWNFRLIAICKCAFIHALCLCAEVHSKWKLSKFQIKMLENEDRLKKVEKMQTPNNNIVKCVVSIVTLSITSTNCWSFELLDKNYPPNEGEKSITKERAKEGVRESTKERHKNKSSTNVLNSYSAWKKQQLFSKEETTHANTYHIVSSLVKKRIGVHSMHSKEKLLFMFV